MKIIDYIVNEYHRDATWWEAKVGYTEENTYMVIVVLSKYECAHLKRELKEVDEHAFVIVKDGMSVVGKYEKAFTRVKVVAFILEAYFQT